MLMMMKMEENVNFQTRARASSRVKIISFFGFCRTCNPGKIDGKCYENISVSEYPILASKLKIIGENDILTHLYQTHCLEMVCKKGYKLSFSLNPVDSCSDLFDLKLQENQTFQKLKKKKSHFIWKILTQVHFYCGRHL